jgi:hypothetical protein
MSLSTPWRHIRDSADIVPLILNLGARWWEVNIMSRPRHPRERTRLPSEQEAGWAPQSVWRFCTREQSVATNGTQTPGCPLRSLVAVPTALSGFEFYIVDFTENVLTCLESKNEKHIAKQLLCSNSRFPRIKQYCKNRTLKKQKMYSKFYC